MDSTQRLTTLVILALTATCSSCPAEPTTKEESRHQAWLHQRVKQAKTIKVGMTQADLLKVFSPAGGLQPIPATRYRLKSCSLIRVDVAFDKKGIVGGKRVSPDEIKITKISGLILDPDFILD